jgi:hypothetical protein
MEFTRDMEFTREVMDGLGAAFPDDEIEFLPRATSGGKALGLAYIDARSVMRRLDAVVGPGNWSFDFDVLAPDGKMVKGKLTVLGVTKCDAGEAGGEDEPLKSAVSDALKRTAVHFGIGRYLYYLPRIWAPYDAQKRAFVEPPRLSPQAVQKALAICGIQPQARGERREAKPLLREAPPVTPAPADRVAEAPVVSEAPEAPRPSIWTAGASPGARPTNGAAATAAPESAGDRAAARTQPGAAAPAAAPGAMLCSGADCGKPLTKGQHDVSLRAFGQPLCPACQKQRARSAA